MKKLIVLLVLCLSTTQLFSQSNSVRLEKTSSFFPEDENIKKENIDWFYLNVPENWDKPNRKQIKIAIAVLKSISKNNDSNSVLYIEGGPGAGGIEGIWSWLSHPLREKNDIILVDVRGTGNSLPKFCPDLGKVFLEILSKNQSSVEDEQQKVAAAIDCKEDLISRKIDLGGYNSKSIAKDFHALKEALKYKNWNIYGTSYGTYIAQVYSNDFPGDIKSIILDSSIPDIANSYYNTSTSKFMSSLEKVFAECKNNPDCNKEFPNLESTYYKTIEKISKRPITVKVDKKIIASGSFTYNVEDFKVCIQQSLYQKKLIEVIPLLIKQFNKEDKMALSSLVAAFSGALSLDYGAFYCVTCNEAFPFNSIAKFNKDAFQYNKLKGGLSFYKSDFLVCDKWNMDNVSIAPQINDLSRLATLKVPVLVFSGEFDPITPPAYGKLTVNKFNNGFLVNFPLSGHAPSFSKLGYKIVNDFIEKPQQKPDVRELESDKKVHFATHVEISEGVSSLANSVTNFNVLFFAPFFIAFMIMIISFFSFCYNLIKVKKDLNQNKFMKFLILCTSIIGLIVVIGLIVAINTTAQNNFYILVFGLPDKFNYLFVFQWIFILFTVISAIYFILTNKFISDRTIIVTILFSFVLINVYFQYWGFLF